MIGLDGSQSLAQALASLPQQLEGVGGGALRSAACRISPMLLDEVGLQGCGDFVGRLQRVVDSPVPCTVVNHAASIARSRASWSSRPASGAARVPRATAVLRTHDVDYFGVYCPDTDAVYLVPITDVPDRGACLRVKPTKNNQAKGVRWAMDY